MANLLVLMEYYRGGLLPVSLEALGHARRLGTALGLSVYALVPLPAETMPGEEDYTERCGRFGADKVILLTGEELFAESELRFENAVDVLVSACQQIAPRLFFIGETPSGLDIAPRLAAQLGAAYLPRGGALAIEDRLELVNSRGSHVRLVEEPAPAANENDTLVDTEDAPLDALMLRPATPVVITIPPGRYDTAQGLQEAEMMIAAAEPEADARRQATASARFVEERLERLPASQRFETLSPYRVAVGPDLANDVQYILCVGKEQIHSTLSELRQLISQPGPAPILPTPVAPGFEFHDESALELTPTAEVVDDAEHTLPGTEGWDGTEETLSGDADSSARIASIVAESRFEARRRADHAPEARRPANPSAATPPAGRATPPTAGSSRGGSPIPFQPPAPAIIRTTTARALEAQHSDWNAWSSNGDEDGLPGIQDGAPEFELETADTAPVPIVPIATSNREPPLPGGTKGPRGQG